MSTNTSPKSGNKASFKKEARLFFEIKRLVAYGDVQSDALREHGRRPMNPTKVGICGFEGHVIPVDVLREHGRKPLNSV